MRFFLIPRAHVLIALLGLTLVVLARPVYGADVEFRWAILAGPGDQAQALDFSGAPVVHSGTELQIYLEHLNNCHIYLYLLDSSNQLTPLYPVDRGYYNYGFPRGPTFIPPGSQSFAFVPPAGSEVFYLIASVDRLFQLERLTEEFLKHQDSLGQQELLLQEIETMIGDKQAKSRAAEDSARVEKKIKTDAGITEVTFEAYEVDMSHFYGRKLLVDHR